MKPPRPTKYQTHETRTKHFQSRFSHFCEHFQIPTNVRSELAAELIAVPGDVAEQQKRLVYKQQIVVPATPELILGKPWNFKDSFLESLKGSGIWSKVSSKERDAARKSLMRNATTISMGTGRPKFSYYELAITYARAIVKSLQSSPKIAGQRTLYARAFPVSRGVGEGNIDNEKPEGPALLLLEATLNLALPYHGSPSRSALEKWVTNKDTKKAIL
jgi:hypothetical protein